MADKPNKGGRPPKFDYDSMEWYTAITRLAMQGCSDTEIAYGLEDELGVRLSSVAFLNMRNGTYDKWTEEENKRRSEELVYVLEHARNRLNSIVRGRFLKSALGGQKVKNVSVTKRRIQVDGVLTDNEVIQTTESESETQPDRQALATWLYHHDKEWRRIQRGIEIGEDIPKAKQGVDITRWIDLENAVREGAKAMEQGMISGVSDDEK